MDVASTEVNGQDFFNPYELQATHGIYTYSIAGVNDVLKSMKNLPGRFQELTNFTTQE